MKSRTESTDSRVREAVRFGHYLLGADPPAEAVERYLAAHDRLFPSEPPGVERALLAAACRGPWSLRLLDAAAGWVGRRSLLRRKLVVMAAILESMPPFADRFEAPRDGPGRTVAALAREGALATAEAVLGLVLYAAVALANRR